jgi:hypothetical protein
MLGRRRDKRERGAAQPHRRTGLDARRRSQVSSSGTDGHAERPFITSGAVQLESMSLCEKRGAYGPCLRYIVGMRPRSWSAVIELSQQPRRRCVVLVGTSHTHSRLSVNGPACSVSTSVPCLRPDDLDSRGLTHLSPAVQVMTSAGTVREKRPGRQHRGGGAQPAGMSEMGEAALAPRGRRLRPGMEAKRSGRWRTLPPMPLPWCHRSAGY